jgi:hypothetical protein
MECLLFTVAGIILVLWLIGRKAVTFKPLRGRLPGKERNE